MADFITDLYKQIGENDENQDVSDWLNTGVIQLNKAIGGSYDKGLPVGRIIEIFGAESCGKTLLATFAIKETQKKGGLGVFLDYEHAFSSSRAVALGMSTDPNQWIYRQPESAEEGFGIVEKIVELARKYDATKPITIVMDSVASMMTKAELASEYDVEESNAKEKGKSMANMKTKLSLPSFLSPALKKMAGIVNKTNITLIFLNQVRDNPGVMYGDKETTPGGRAMKFYASVRIKLRKGEKIKGDDGDIIGQVVEAEVIKNKVSAPFRKAEYNGSFTEGIDLHATLLNEAVEMGLIEKAGAYLVGLDGKKLYRSVMEKAMRAEPKVYDALLSSVMKHVKVKEVVAEEMETAA